MEFNTKLYSHQRDAVNKLIHVKVGALYMEQGTGKTRTSLELINERIAKKKINHVLWLCPCSVKQNLRLDIIEHVGYVPNFITICGIETLSSSDKWNLKLLNIVKKYKCYLIVDESNLVKNYRAIRTGNIIRLSENCEYKLILNGTPISRNEADLFAQWYILDWRILGYKSYWSFSANHIEYDERIRGKIRRCLNTDYLAEKIAPYTFEKRKSECLDIPDKSYSTVYYNLTEEQDILYMQVADNLMFELDEWKPWTVYKLFTGLQDVISGLYVDTSCANLRTEPLFNNPIDNPRIQCLLDTLDDFDDKIIIFCKYTHEITDIYNVLTDNYGSGSSVMFYGDINQSKRQENIEMFKSKARFFIANKTCAGYGLNLQFCNNVIYYSNDWNYATRAQSEDRVHRIGQDKNVNIIDICAENTLDEKILRCLCNKEDLVESFKDEVSKNNEKNVYSWVRPRRVDIENISKH